MTPWFYRSRDPAHTVSGVIAKTQLLWMGHIEKMLQIQIRTLQSCAEMGTYQWRAAAEITDFSRLNAFCRRQTLMAQMVRHKWRNDLQRASLFPSARWAA